MAGYVTLRIEQAAVKLRSKQYADVDWDAVNAALADHLDQVADNWLGSEENWAQLREAFAVLKVVDAILAAED